MRQEGDGATLGHARNAPIGVGAAEPATVAVTAATPIGEVPGEPLMGGLSAEPATGDVSVDVGRRSGSTGRGRSRRRLRRVRVLIVVAIVGLVLVGYYLVSLAQVWSTGRSDQAQQVDAIVVLGAAQYDGRPSPQLAARLDHVVELWPDGLAPAVIVTGGNRPGDRFTEAEASANYLVDRGIPADAILQEGTGSTTYESMQSVADLLESRAAGASGSAGSGDRVLIVTDPYHALRSRLIAQELGLTAYVSPTETSVVTGAGSLRRHAQEAAGVAVGRVIGFRRLSVLTD